MRFAVSMLVLVFSGSVSLGNTFHISVVGNEAAPVFELLRDGKRAGSVAKKSSSMNIEYEFRDADSQLQARARRALFPWGTRIEVWDGAGAQVGTVQEEVVRSRWGRRARFAVFDAQGRQIAESDNIDKLARQIPLRARDGAVVGELEGTDARSMRFQESTTIDRRLLLLTAIHKLDAELVR